MLYLTHGKLGSGTYGVVYMAKERKKDGTIVAIKIMHTQKEGNYDCLTTISQLREIKLIKELHHPNIVIERDVLYNYSIKELAIVYEYGMYTESIFKQSRVRSPRFHSLFRQCKSRHPSVYHSELPMADPQCDCLSPLPLDYAS